MERSSDPTKTDAETVDAVADRRRHRNWYMVTVAVAAAIILSTVVLSAGEKDKGPVFGIYDDLNYTVSGVESGRIVGGNINISLRAGMTITYPIGNYSNIVEMDQYIWKEGPRSQWVSDHAIDTTWGKKTVSTYFEYHYASGKGQCMMLTDVGIDTGVVYRKTLFTPDILVTVVLTYTNSTRVPDADTRVHEAVATGLNDVRSEPDSVNVLKGNGGLYTYGSLRISEGQHIKYNLTALGGYFMVFSGTDLIHTENDRLLQHRQEVSMGLNQTGEIDKELPEGTYWFCLAIAESPNGGYLYRYW